MVEILILIALGYFYYAITRRRDCPPKPFTVILGEPIKPPCYHTLATYTDIAENDCTACRHYRDCLSQIKKEFINVEGRKRRHGKEK